MALFSHAVAWLRENWVLLPGVSVLARQVSEGRAVAEKRLHTAVTLAARRADPALPAELAALLEMPRSGAVSSGRAAAAPDALERVDEDLRSRPVVREP